VALSALPNGLLEVPVMIDGIEMRALLDTGAPLTIVNTAAARALGITKSGA
jgi:predicted aspartyl protease